MDGGLGEHVGFKTPWAHLNLLSLYTKLHPTGMPRTSQIFGGVILLHLVLVVVTGGNIVNFKSEFWT